MESKKRAGGEPGPYYTNGYTNAARIPSLAAANTAFVTVYLYSRLPYLVVALSMQRATAQPKSVSLSTPMQNSGSGLRRIHLPCTRVNKGMKKGRDRQEPRLFHLTLELSVSRLARLVYDNLTGRNLRWVRHQGS